VGEKVVLEKADSLPAPKGSHARVGGYVHHNGRAGALVRVACEKEASLGALEGLLKDLAMHVVAAMPPPVAVGRDDIPKEILEKEEAIQADTEEIRKKPEQIRGKILKGKMERFIKERALLEQQLLTAAEEKLTVKAALERAGKDLSDSLVVEGFLRFELGE
jgi:elongation factor Ts